MKKQYLLLFSVITCSLLNGCAIFPKEEELVRTPIIEAYEREEFKMAEVQRGDLQKYETIDAVCMNVGETRYSFAVSNLAYNGVYVQLGEHVSAGTKLADLVVSYTDTDVANESQVVLTAKEDATVTYVYDADDGEKSVAGQLVIVTNSKDSFYLNSYTEYYDKFKIGDTVSMHIEGADYMATVVSPAEIGILEDSMGVTSDGKAQIFFKIKEDNLFLISEDVGSVTVLVEEKKDVLYIPKRAITTVDDEEIVYVENSDGIRSVKYVKTGLEADNKIEILEGLEEGDKVILE